MLSMLSTCLQRHINYSSGSQQLEQQQIKAGPVDKIMLSCTTLILACRSLLLICKTCEYSAI